MKGTIKIPAQEITFDFQPIWEVEPPTVTPTNPEPETPKPEPEPQKPEPIGGNFILLEDFDSWNDAINQAGKILVLGANKTYHIKGYKTAEPRIKAIVGNNSTIITDLDAPRYMFSFTKDNPEFGTIGVNFWQTDLVKFKPATKVCILFFTDFQTVSKGKLALLDSKRPPKDQLSHQLAWAYSRTNGDDGKFLHVIAEQVETNGSEFLTLKANGGGGIMSTLQNVDIWNPDSYNPNAILVNGQVINNIFSLDPDEKYNVSDIRTHYGYHSGNIRTILHIGRFVFNIKDESVINDREIRLDVEKDTNAVKLSEYSVGCKMDYQCGDVTNLGIIRKKQINANHYWEYLFDDPVNDITDLIVQKSSFNLKGDEQAYLIFKHTYLFSDPGLTENTKFGDWYVLFGKRYGHTMYNHRNISAWWNNVSMTGFYRQSSPDNEIGQSKGYTINEIKGFGGEFNPPLLVDKPINKEVKKYIDYLKSVRKEVFGVIKN